MFIFDSVSVGYASKPVLQDVSFQVPLGTVLALIGANGSGKTTLIRAASGVLPIQSGSISLGGKKLAEMNSQERARHIAVVPQTRSLPPAFTAREVVALGRTPHLNWLGKMSDHDQEVIQRALEHTDLVELADRNVYELSGGEQQRLFLARALAQEANLLLMDEPTTHLDLKYQVNLMQRLHRLAHPTAAEREAGFKPRTVVTAIHDLNLISSFADLVGLLMNGRLQILASPSEVLRSELLSEAYGVSLKVMGGGKDPLLVTPSFPKDAI